MRTAIFWFTVSALSYLAAVVILIADPSYQSAAFALVALVASGVWAFEISVERELARVKRERGLW